ncbi:hypothetical protein ACWGCW_00645 [Streptomyces sp. NPDC054933]
MTDQNTISTTSTAAPDNPADQLAALRAWLTAEALKIRRRLPLMRAPEARQAMDGKARGLESTVRVIDRFMATGKLPTTAGRECDCTDPETQHRATATDTLRDDELAQARARIAELESDLEHYEETVVGDLNEKNIALARQAARAEATIARVRALAADMRTWCSPHGISVDYADRIVEALNAAPTPEAGR